MSNDQLLSLHKKLIKSYGDDVAQSVIVALLERKKPLTNPPAWANRLGYVLTRQWAKKESVLIQYNDKAEGRTRAWRTLGHRRASDEMSNKRLSVEADRDKDLPLY